MKTYYVTVKIEETIEVEASSEEDATYLACGAFDPLCHDKEVVEVYTKDDEV